MIKMPWLLMWTIALTLFAACKWLTWQAARSSGLAPGASRSAGYLFGWVGMDARAFLRSAAGGAKPAPAEWIFAASKLKFVNNLLVTVNTAAIGEAVAASKPQDEIVKAVNAEAALETDMAMIELRAFSKFAESLEPEQQQRAGMLFQMMRGMFDKKNWNSD